jgi:hypothetical protein
MGNNRITLGCAFVNFVFSHIEKNVSGNNDQHLQIAIRLHISMKKLLPCISFLLLLSACSTTPADPKQSIRIGWQTYFNAYLDQRGKESQMGTDSTKLVFENNSDYAVDSAILIFENQGLLVHSFDTVCIKSIPPKTQKSAPAPSHKLGFKRKVNIFAIYSKPLEFGYRSDLPEEKRKGDCYHCK